MENNKNLYLRIFVIINIQFLSLLVLILLFFYNSLNSEAKILINKSNLSINDNFEVNKMLNEYGNEETIFTDGDKDYRIEYPKINLVIGFFPDFIKLIIVQFGFCLITFILFVLLMKKQIKLS